MWIWIWIEGSSSAWKRNARRRPSTMHTAIHKRGDGGPHHPVAPGPRRAAQHRSECARQACSSLGERRIDY
eukprot:5762866-Pyramimonas_sp.AAC.1